jgi:hypothetical protein
LEGVVGVELRLALFAARDRQHAITAAQDATLLAARSAAVESPLVALLACVQLTVPTQVESCLPQEGDVTNEVQAAQHRTKQDEA